MDRETERYVESRHEILAETDPEENTENCPHCGVWLSDQDTHEILCNQCAWDEGE